MRFTPATRMVQALTPALANGADFTAITVDTQSPNGYDYMTIVFQLGATDVALSALKLTESDDDSSYSDVTGGGFTGSNLPSATDDGKNWVWNVQLSGARKRYYKVVATAASGSTGAQGACLAILANYTEAPFNATTQNAKAIINL
ncbi:MAG: hypothetical protein KGH93_03335 [Patescibacteria group bacterium]|nr:hypothetical protein [Patescibacteria group bacterium]